MEKEKMEKEEEEEEEEMFSSMTLEARSRVERKKRK